jgi:lipopolysaccharide transport system permease protein
MVRLNVFYSLWRYRSLSIELVKREIFGRYRGSFGGAIWSFVQPLFMLAVYTIAFGVVLKTRWGFAGSAIDYGFLLLSGLIVFNLFVEILTKGPLLITNSPNFVKKIVFPLELLPVIAVVSAVVHALIGLGVWILGYTLLVGIPHLTVLWAPLILVCFIPILLSVAWLLSAVGVVVKDINQLTGMLGQALFFLTPIFYKIEDIPETLRGLLGFNPLVFIIGQVRAVLFYGDLPDFQGLTEYFTLTSLLAWVMYLLFARMRPSFADMV